MKNLLLCLFLLGCLLPFFGGAVARAESTDLTVKILPQDCLFETINDGTNEIRYLTPEACGEIIPAPQPQPQPSQTSPSTGTTRPPSSFFFIRQPDGSVSTIGNDLYLNDFSEYSTEAGKTLYLRVGQKVYFGVMTHGKIELHSVSLKEIGANFVIITVASTPTDARLFVGDKKQFDVTNDNTNDIEVTLGGIVGDVARMTFRQPHTPRQPSTHAFVVANETSNLWFVVGLALTMCAILGYAVYRRKSKKSC